MKRIILIALLLQGCIVDNYNYELTHPDIMYVGDSLCYKVFDTDTGIDSVYENEDYQKTAQAMLGIASNCVPGRRSTDLTELPKGKRITILALATNDVGRTDINVFADKYADLVYNSDSDIVYCVLPNAFIGNKSSEEYREVISGICANIIDPNEYGVTFRANDGVHMTEIDHRLWHKALKGILDI